MKLMTAEIGKALHEADAMVLATGKTPDPIVVKYFNPMGAGTWHIASGTPMDDHGDPTTPDKALDWCLYGLCDLGFGADCTELGYVMLSELENVGKYQILPIERDIHFEGLMSELLADLESQRARASVAR